MLMPMFIIVGNNVLLRSHDLIYICDVYCGCAVLKWLDRSGLLTCQRNLNLTSIVESDRKGCYLKLDSLEPCVILLNYWLWSTEYARKCIFSSLSCAFWVSHRSFQATRVCLLHRTSFLDDWQIVVLINARLVFVCQNIFTNINKIR